MQGHVEGGSDFTSPLFVPRYTGETFRVERIAIDRARNLRFLAISTGCVVMFSFPAVMNARNLLS